jgi:HK97 family phage prohead protease
MKTDQNLNKREIRSITAAEFRVSTNSDGSKTVAGYAILYNSQSVDLGGFKEIVAPGALTRTLQERPDVLCLRDHKTELLLGRTNAGTLTLEDQPTGLHFTVKLPATTAGSDTAESLSRGDIDGCSFGFSVRNDIWNDTADGTIIRTLLDIDLYEISITSFPAYQSTTAALRSAPVEIRTRIEHRDDEPQIEPLTERSDDTSACVCTCPECVAGDCADCSDLDCDDEECACSMRATRNRKRLEARLRLLELSL